MKKIIFTLLAIGLKISAFAQINYQTQNSSQILHGLQQLNSFGTVMYLAAHPDDENTRLISYLVHERNVRTIYYSLTRGDGGQNIIGNEQGQYLGLIRTLEMNEARKLDGAEQIYSSAVDFGFSKNPEEVFTKWDKKQLLKEIKSAFQNYRPDVVILRFPTTGEGGHGQHTASAILAVEAFRELEQEARTNPNIFVPTRILFNAFNFGDRSTQKEDQLKITINQYNPLLGKSYGQLAGESRSMHKSQGAGTPQSFGIYKEYFQHLGGKEAKNDILEDLNYSWKALGYPKLDNEIKSIINQYNPLHPEYSIPALTNLFNQLEGKKNSNILISAKLNLIKQLIANAAQLTIESIANAPVFNNGAIKELNINIAARAKNVILKNIHTTIENIISPNTVLAYDSLYNFKLKDKQKNIPTTQPYWLEQEIKNWHFPAMVNTNSTIPFTSNNNCLVQLNINGVDIDVIIPIQYKRLDPLRGDVVNPIRYQQDINIQLLQPLIIVEDNFAKIPITIQSKQQLESIKIFTTQNNTKKLWGTITASKKELDSTLTLSIPKNEIQSNWIEISAEHNNQVYSGTTKVLKYDHIPETQYKIPSQQKVVVKDWTTKVKNIGYVQGADDLVDDVLKSLDFNVVNLNKTDFQNDKYTQQFDAIVVGIRAYNVNEDIATIHPLLMNYINNGGTVIAQYNTDKNLKTDQLGPYPFKVSRNRITQEDAPTTILNASHRLLNYPNKIASNDWDNWIQERGIYYPHNWDNKYQTIIQHQEFEEQPLNSGILYTSFGKGHYIYTPLAFFRQLPDGNSGAIKLFINLLSVGK